MSDQPSEKPEASQQKLLTALRQTISKAGESFRKGAQISGQSIQDTIQTTRAAAGTVRRKLGEDYYAILDENPLVLDTFSRSDLLIGDRELLLTAFNIPWTTTLLWSAVTGSTVSLQRPIARVLGDLLHYGPGHIKRWDDINKFMDNVVGAGHRLKSGHSIDYLPQIVEKFGFEGVPAYFMHLLQDFMTVDGIPIVPHAWDIKEILRLKGIPPKMATGIVSASFSGTLGALTIIKAVEELRKFGKDVAKRVRIQKYLENAKTAIQSHDYEASIVNYQRVLEIEKSPHILIDLGRVYMRRASNRFRAHQSFFEALNLLAVDPDAVIPYKHAKISIRGLAGIHALATADVLAGIHPEHWNDHVQNLVNATVSSFNSVASKQAKQSDNLIASAAITPPLFSAAINYYLAAKSACSYPFIEERQEKVLRNVQASVRFLRRIAQYDEEKLRPKVDTILQLWVMELLPPDEIETVLFTY